MSPLHYQRQYTPLRKSTHRGGNPYFRSRSVDRVTLSRVKNSAARIPFRIWAYLILFVLTMLALGWLVCLSPFLTIKYVDISEANEGRIQTIERLAWEQTEQSRLWFFSQSHLLLFDSEMFKKRLSEEYVFNEVRIQKKLPNTIKIIVTEKNPVATWFESDMYYVIDSEGWVVDSAIGPLEGLVAINNNGQPKLNNKRLEGQEGLIKASLELKASLDSNFSYLNVAQIVITHERNTISLVLKEGVIIYFTIEEPISVQLERLDILVKGQLASKLSRISYIDLRFRDRVYYK